ncbi:hypothetical protein HMPREF2978_00490 [Corynebacterium sp. HMSC074C01]|uniref:glycosyltransferase family 4 protein n=1 Tax=Corynebacterium sp. HMSC074C01 TaxID=1739482 RepID=UPI0008A56E72|nr:glycosyltransferase family 4 protein [Corynebacterium sp. HMSC074C01]OFP64470.1 hypothetical protein HMPREF2978_00490 [Corynebacterium sp. HMSC074C01]
MNLRFGVKQWLFLLGTAKRMLAEDPQAFCNSVLEKTRQKIPFEKLKLGLQRIKFSRIALEGDDEYRRGELSRAIGLYEASNEGRVKAKAGKRFARRVRQQKAQLLRAIDVQELGVKRPESWDSFQYDGVVWFLNNSLPYTQSGYTYRSHSSLKALQASGIGVQAVTRLGYPVVIGSLAKSSVQSIDGVRYHRLVPSRYPADLKTREDLTVEMLLACVRSIRPQVLHTTTDFRNAQVVSRVASETGIPWVYEVRGELENTWLSKVPEGDQGIAKESEYYLLARERETEAMKAANAVIALSNVAKGHMVDRGVDESKIFVVPNAIDSEDLSRQVDVKQIRRELGLDVDSKWFGTVTSVVGYEGLDLAVRALGELGNNWKLLVVGEGTDLPRLINLARDLGVERRVVFAGRQDNSDIWKWYAALDVFVIPRIDSEVCRNVTPLKPLLAKAVGVPTVSSNLPALKEVSGVGGLLFEPGNLQDFVVKIKKACANERLIEDARNWVQERTWQSNARRYRNIYAYLQERNKQAY